MTQLNRIALHYDNVVLNQPRLFDERSRSDCDTSVQFGPMKFKAPVVPANMKCVIGPESAAELMQSGYFHIMHRFANRGSVGGQMDQLIKYIVQHSMWKSDLDMAEFPGYYTSLSVGIGEKDYDFVDHCAKHEVRLDYLTIDIARGHQRRMIDTIGYYKMKLPKTFIIAGNVCTPEAVEELEEAGADATKVGIGPGKACTTARETGFMSPMFTAIQRCAAVAKKPIIADGGVRCSGDVTKALVAGATMVMVGSMFAACKDSPGKTYYNRNWLMRQITGDRSYKKEYYGSASEFNKGSNSHVEGTRVLVDGNGLLQTELMDKMKERLQSSISYAGGNDLSILTTVPFDVVT